MSDVSFHSFRYNAARFTFQAQVSLRSGSRILKHSCEVLAPASIDLATVRNRMIDQARRMSDAAGLYWAAP